MEEERKDNILGEILSTKEADHKWGVWSASFVV